MMHFNKNEGSEEILRTEMDYERSRPQKDGPCSRRTGLLVLLGTVAMMISMIIILVICGDLVKRFTKVQHSVSSLNLYLNKSSDPVTNGSPEKRLSDIERIMTNLESLSSLTSKQDEDLRRLEERLISSLNELKAQINTKSSSGSPEKRLSDIERLMNNLKSSLSSLTSKQNEDLRRLENKLISRLNELKSQINTKSSSDKPLPNCTSGWTPYGSSCYLFSSKALNWMKARDYCKEQGASLLKLDGSDEEEWEFLTSTTGSIPHWIGLTDQTTGQWRWSDDTPFTDDKLWEEGQPDEWKEHGLGEDGEEGEDCGHINWRGKINDVHCSTKYKYICKVEPEPETN